MSDSLPPPIAVETGRLAKIGAVCIAAGLIGFVSVLRDRVEPQGFAAEAPVPSELSATGHSVPPARAYAELRKRRDGNAAMLHELGLQRMRSALPAPTASVSRTPEDRQRAAAARAERRAFNGAPPTIPHVVDQREQSACLACHETGLVLAGRVAPAMSHAPFSSCLQCHVVSEPPGKLQQSAFAGNAFEHTGFARQGERAWPGAPPTVPHSSWMRERCASCHGVSGRLGVRTTHPQRQSCKQCHALSSELDQRQFSATITATQQGPE